ncbi:uncharacterized protein C2845_PM05G15310 [Panicum miliaceum]|uniref:Uncharacterized protein n=1 Tax=Panicum miliaceum TaxID=4540 RepID=A0A3L6SV03_PANMI|nr:uncharacterized protein C2845_PM05G15310 [Panicum miliaceum]
MAPKVDRPKHPPTIVLGRSRMTDSLVTHMRRTDDILGSESSTEYKAIRQKLGGTRSNRVFMSFGVPAPQRKAAEERRLAEEKKKGVKAAEEKGNFKDAPGGDRSPIAATPVSSRPPPPVGGGVKDPLTLDLSDLEAESDEAQAKKIVIYEVVTPSIQLREGIDLSPSGRSSGSENPRDKAVAEPRGSADSEGSEDSDSGGVFVSTEDPTVVAAELNVSGAHLVGGRAIGSLRFESGKRERRLLSEAGGSFCFPLMEKELMKSGVASMLRCAKDLSLKAFVAARCANRQLETKGSSSKSRISELEEKVALLEREKLDAEEALKNERKELATAREDLKSLGVHSKDLADKLAEAHVKAEIAEARAAKSESKRQVSRTRFVGYRQALTNGINVMRDEVPWLLSSFGLTASELASPDDLEIHQFFEWLLKCLAMLESASHFYGDLSAIVAARTLAASVYHLLPAKGSGSQGIMKAQLCSLRDRSFGWPSEEAVQPDQLPALPKNVAKNFIESFFKVTGPTLVCREGLRLKDQMQLKAEAYADEMVKSRSAADTSTQVGAGASGILSEDALRKTTEAIIDIAVRVLIDEIDHAVFDE